MTNQEKQCYNTYLRISRSVKNKPFRLRNNFDKFEETKDYHHVKQLCSFFNKWPQINYDFYFKAPYVIYPDQQHFQLDFYTTQRAIKTYTLYLKHLRNQNPDNQEMLDLIRSSLKFIAKYCVNQNILIEDYLLHKEGITYAWMIHLKEFQICIYPLFGFKDFVKFVKQIPREEQESIFDDLITQVQTCQIKYLNSKTSKQIIKDSLKKLSGLVKKYVDK